MTYSNLDGLRIWRFRRMRIMFWTSRKYRDYLPFFRSETFFGGSKRRIFSIGPLWLDWHGVKGS